MTIFFVSCDARTSSNDPPIAETFKFSDPAILSSSPPLLPAIEFTSSSAKRTFLDLDFGRGADAVENERDKVDLGDCKLAEDRSDSLIDKRIGIKSMAGDSSLFKKFSQLKSDVSTGVEDVKVGVWLVGASRRSSAIKGEAGGLLYAVASDDRGGRSGFLLNATRFLSSC